MAAGRAFLPSVRVTGKAGSRGAFRVRKGSPGGGKRGEMLEGGTPAGLSVVGSKGGGESQGWWEHCGFCKMRGLR